MTSHDIYNFQWAPFELWESLEWPRLFKFLVFWAALAAHLVLALVLIVPALVLFAWECIDE